MDTLFILGGFVFTPSSFAIPERVNGGGKQKTIVHKLIGGIRVIDCMGFDPDDITFSGRFRGATAAIQAKLLETISRSGKPVTFSYYLQIYTAIVADVQWEYERYYEVTFKVRLEIISDQTAALLSGALSTLDSLIDADNSLVQSITGLLPTVNAAMGAFSTARAAIGTLQGASTAALLPASVALGTAAVAASSVATSLGAGVAATAGGVTAGGNAASMATGLVGQASGMSGLTNAVQAGAVIGRMQTNLGAPQ